MTGRFGYVRKSNGEYTIVKGEDTSSQFVHIATIGDTGSVVVEQIVELLNWRARNPGELDG